MAREEMQVLVSTRYMAAQGPKKVPKHRDELDRMLINKYGISRVQPKAVKGNRDEMAILLSNKYNIQA